MHAAYMVSGIAIASASALLALWLADRTPAWGDRRVLHGFALVAPLLCALLLGAVTVKMLVISCTRFSPQDWLLSVLLVASLAGAVGASLVAHGRRFRRAALLRRELGRLQKLPCDPRATAALERAMRQSGIAMALRLQVIGTRRPIALVWGVLRPTVVVSTGMLAILDDAELEATLVHEIFHLKNGDLLFSATLGWARGALAVLPVGRSAWGRYLADRERIADAMSARATGRPEVLAGALVKVWEAGQPSLGAEGAAHRAPVLASDLEERVDGLLESGGSVAPRALTALAAGSLMVLLLATGALSAPLWSESLCMRLLCSR